MNFNFNSFFTKFKDWKEAKVNKQPLSAKNAYSIYAINKETSLTSIYDKLKEEVLEAIKIAARDKNLEIYFVYPSYMTVEHKNLLIKDLQALDYNIPYVSARSIIISWEIA